MRTNKERTGNPAESPDQLLGENTPSVGRRAHGTTTFYNQRGRRSSPKFVPNRRRLKESESAITAAADGRATIPSLLRRLVKKCKQYPQLKQQLRSWWESAQDLLPEEAGEARWGHHTALLTVGIRTSATQAAGAGGLPYSKCALHAIAAHGVSRK